MKDIKIPKNTISWLRYYDENHILKYIIVSDQQVTKYTLYKVLDDMNLEKIRTAKEPTFKECGY